MNMARGYAYDEDYDQDTGVTTTSWYACTTSKLSLENIDSGAFDFSFITEDSETGVLGNVNKILELLESYNTNTNAYSVDEKNDFSEAYVELKTDVETIAEALNSLKSDLEKGVKDIESEINTNYNWAYNASFSNGTNYDR